MRIKLDIPLSVRRIAMLSGAELTIIGDGSCLQAVTHVTFDSREAEAGDLFIALAGAHTDGHLHLKEASRKGARAFLCTHIEDDFPSGCYLLTDNVMDALVSLAHGYASRIPHKTIAVTGSVGKSTICGMLASILRLSAPTHATSGNQNNLLGTCYTLLSMKKGTQYLVAECGMDGRGQISRLSKLLSPDISVISRIGISHIEKLGSRAEIAKAKLEILDGMHDGILFVPYDEPLISSSGYPHMASVSTMDTGADYYIAEWHEQKECTRFSAVLKGRYLPSLTLHVSGLHYVSDAIFSCAIADALGVTDDCMRAGLSSFRALPMRQHLTETKGIRYIDDTYNACPESVYAALRRLKTLASPGERKICILSDMAELGKLSHDEHEKIGQFAAKMSVNYLVCIGEYAADILKGAVGYGFPEENCLLLPFSSCPEEYVHLISPHIEPGDIVLLKGSRASRLERLLEALRHTE